jgi:hypothetical protein
MSRQEKTDDNRQRDLTGPEKPVYRAFSQADFERYIDTEFGSQSSIAWHTKDFLIADGEGRKGAELYLAVSNALSLLVKAAGCFWACRKGSHLEENLLRRVVNYSLACCRIAMFGLYDEALALLRSLAEVANLVQLFALDVSALKQWTDLSGSDRWKEFKPKPVRDRITSLRRDPIVDQLSYSRLCEFGAHVTPSSVFVSHEADRIGYIGGHFSGPAFVMILNELAVILGPLLPYAGNLVALQPAELEQLEDVSTIINASAANWLRLDSYRERLDQALSSGDTG